MEGSSSGLRKGAWTKIEDDLLKSCIDTYGEGKWHLVPERAGLNRCRKSCRLRWLNYLKPDIKRGVFSEDEVDLMIRMHKLLGNRWSLIAGRLPRRTPNDVKNYWNTYMRRNENSLKKGKKVTFQEKETTTTAKTHEVIKPQPQTFSRKSAWLQRKNFIPSNHSNNSKAEVIDKGATSSGSTKNWWETLLDGIDEHDNNIFSLGGEDGELMNGLLDEQLTSITTNGCDFLTELDAEIFNLLGG